MVFIHHLLHQESVMPQESDTIALQEQIKGGVLIVKMVGRLDGMTTPAAEKRIFDQIYAGHNNILLDFSVVDYVSSAGMRMLLSMTKKLKHQGKFVICSVKEDVLNVFKMSGFDALLDIVANKELALRKF